MSYIVNGKRYQTFSRSQPLRWRLRRAPGRFASAYRFNRDYVLRRDGSRYPRWRCAWAALGGVRRLIF